MDEIPSLCADLFEIRHGEVWRVMTTTRTGRAVPCEPKRADKPRYDGYRYVCVGKKKVLAHRAVWFVYNGEIPADHEINHKNGIRDDNRIENLEIVTKSENMLHSYDHLDRFRASGTRNGRSKLSEEQVLKIRMSDRASRNLAKIYGVSKTTINRIKAGERWNEVPG